MTMLKPRSGDPDRGANSTAFSQTLKERWGGHAGAQRLGELLIFAAARSFYHPPTPPVFEYVLKLCHCWRLCVASLMAVVKDQNMTKTSREV